MSSTPAYRAGEGRVSAVRRARVGHEVVEVDNGLVRLVIAPALGGRVLSAVRDGREFLHRNPELLDDALGARDPRTVGPHDGPMSAWRNWGGDKTWPAPQGWSGPGEWAGPRMPFWTRGRTPARWTSRTTARAPTSRSPVATIRAPGCA
ncbi:hypothetical protein D3C59_30545 [Streptomyces sp. SHP22-7]|nr:hypothetical protein D3C59_30545 [Streptomyces sp. SHP22-7]